MLRTSRACLQVSHGRLTILVPSRAQSCPVAGCCAFILIVTTSSWQVKKLHPGYSWIFLDSYIPWDSGATCIDGEMGQHHKHQQFWTATLPVEQNLCNPLSRSFKGSQIVFHFSVLIFYFLFCPFSLLFAAFWAWKLLLPRYLQPFWLRTYFFDFEPFFIHSFCIFSWNLQHFGAGSCHFNGFVSPLNPCSAMFSIHAVVVSLAGCVGLGVDFYQRMLVCCFVALLLCCFVAVAVAVAVVVVVVVVVVIFIVTVIAIAIVVHVVHVVLVLLIVVLVVFVVLVVLLFF